MSNPKSIPPLVFERVKDAINYRSNCPICNAQLHVNDKDLATGYCDNEHDILSFYIDQYYQDVAGVNIETNEVVLYVERRFLDVIYDISTKDPIIGTPTKPSYYGKYMHGLGVDCKTCCQYNFTLQIHFEIGESNKAFAILNSERVTVEDIGMVHEIKNSYATNLTYYSYFDKDGNTKSEVIPLVPLDLSNPKETANRIRKLLIFS